MTAISDPPSKPAALLLSSFGGVAVLHVFENGSCIRTATGTEKSLRLIFESQFQIVAFGVCKVCGCTDDDCRSCIERTGRTCSWANDEHTLCTACALGLMKLAK